MQLMSNGPTAPAANRCRGTSSGREWRWLPSAFTKKTTKCDALHTSLPAGVSAAGHTFGANVNRVDRAAGGHHQPIALAAAETEVGAALRESNPSNHRRVWSKDNDAILS